MSEWLSYRPGDFLMFSPRVYERLFELHNQALWPAQLLALALGAAVLVALLRPRPASDRLVALLLGAAWLLVAWTFLWQRYAPINLAIPYLAPLFVLQALLLVGLGTLRGGWRLADDWSLARVTGVGLFFYALAVHPLLALRFGRGLAGAEVLGLTPDPLAIATLGVACMAAPGRRAWGLLVVPCLWCLFSGLTLYLLGLPGAWLAPLAAGMALVARWRSD